MSVKSGQAVTVIFPTRHPASGAPTDADATPTGTLYVNGVANAATVTVTNITTGRYKAAVTLPSLTAGDILSLLIAATVSTVAQESVEWQDVADTKRVSDLRDEAMRGTDSAALASVCTEARLAELDAANLPADVAGVLAKVLNAAGVRSAVGLAAANLDTQLDSLGQGFVNGDTLVTQATTVSGVAIGRTTAGATVTAYLSSDTDRATPLRQATADADGDWSIYLTGGSTYTLVFSKDGYSEATQEVTVA